MISLISEKVENRAKRIIIWLLIGGMITYVCQSIFSIFGLGFLPYILTVVSIILCLSIKTPHKKTNYVTLLFFGVGVLAFFISLVLIKENQVFVGVAGFLVMYVNAIVWCLLFSRLDRKEAECAFDVFVKTFILLGCFVSITGIYQTFVDRTILGFATNTLYSNEVEMSSGHYVIRATGILGSAQNYGFLVGSSFATCLIYSGFKGYLKGAMLLVLLLGVLVSGSRSASACLIIAIVYFVFSRLKYGKVKHTLIICWCLLIAIGFVAAVVLNEFDILGNSTLGRLLDFSLSESVKVYINTLGTITPVSIMAGNGIGYASWTVYQILGTVDYMSAYGVPYSSVESYFLLLFVQSGLLGLFALIVLFGVAFLKSWRLSQTSFVFLLSLFVNMVLTPSFSGMAISFIGWLFVAYSLFCADSFKRPAEGRKWTKKVQ